MWDGCVPGGGGGGRAGAVSDVGDPSVSAAAARVNIFEWMFHPDRRPAFTSASGVTMDADAMLMTIRLNGEDRAYPITVMAYHHIVNDWIGETPVAATY